MEVSPGFRPGTHIIHGPDGHTYYLNKVMNGGRLSLKCHMYYGRHCLGRASVDQQGDYFKAGRGRHNHEPRHNLKHERRFRAAVLNECRLEESMTQNLEEIYFKVKREMRILNIALVNVPYVKLRPSMQRARAEVMPNIPHSLSELAITLEDPANEFLHKTLDGEDRLYLGKFGQTAEGTRCIVFASRRALEYMAAVKEVQSDATFSSVPAGLQDCSQIWTILSVRRNHVLPLVRVLMQSKKEECYKVALQAIRNILPHFCPQKVKCDFELAQANAWESMFPLIEVSGCLFHSSKAIVNHAKELGMVPEIRDNETVDSLVRSLCALALLPWYLLFEGIASVAFRSFQEGLWGIMAALLLYVLKTWFSPSRLRMLSVFGDKHRTSNACESANASLRGAVKMKHPNVWFFLSVLVKLEDKTKFDIDVLNACNTPSRARGAAVIANDSTIKGLQEDLEEGNVTVDLFLRRASRTLQGLYDEVLD